MASRFIIEGDIPTNGLAPTPGAVVTVRRRDGVNGTVTMTYTEVPIPRPHSAWVLTGPAVPVSGYPVTGSYVDFDSPSGDHYNLGAMRAAKSHLLGVTPGDSLVNRRSRRELADTREVERRARIRESKRAYMERWRKANPELARAKTLEAVHAHRARKKAYRAKFPAIDIVPKTDEDEAAVRKALPVAVAGRCLTCGFVGPLHYTAQGTTAVVYEMRRHYKPEHPGKWNDPERPKGTFLWEYVPVNADGEFIDVPLDRVMLNDISF